MTARKRQRRRTGLAGPADDLAREGQRLVMSGRCAEAAAKLGAARRHGASPLVLDYAQTIYDESCEVSARAVDFSGLSRTVPGIALFGLAALGAVALRNLLRYRNP